MCVPCPNLKAWLRVTSKWSLTWFHSSFFPTSLYHGRSPPFSHPSAMGDLLLSHIPLPWGISSFLTSLYHGRYFPFLAWWRPSLHSSLGNGLKQRLSEPSSCLNTFFIFSSLTYWAASFKVPLSFPCHLKLVVHLLQTLEGSRSEAFATGFSVWLCGCHLSFAG